MKEERKRVEKEWQEYLKNEMVQTTFSELRGFGKIQEGILGECRGRYLEDCQCFKEVENCTRTKKVYLK